MDVHSKIRGEDDKRNQNTVSQMLKHYPNASEFKCNIHLEEQNE
jgi:hypothetical protein